MNLCPSCGGVLGRDCFNPQECALISQQQIEQIPQWQQEIQDLRAENERLKAIVERKNQALRKLKQIIDWWMIGYFDTEHDSESVTNARKALKALDIETTACLWHKLDTISKEALSEDCEGGTIDAE